MSNSNEVQVTGNIQAQVADPSALVYNFRTLTV